MYHYTKQETWVFFEKKTYTGATYRFSPIFQQQSAYGNVLQLILVVSQSSVESRN